MAKNSLRVGYQKGLNDLLQTYTVHKLNHDSALSCWRASEIGSKEAEDFYEEAQNEEIAANFIARDIAEFLIAYKDILFEE